MGHPLAGSCVALNIIRSIDHDQPQKKFQISLARFTFLQDQEFQSRSDKLQQCSSTILGSLELRCRQSMRPRVVWRCTCAYLLISNRATDFAAGCFQNNPRNLAFKQDPESPKNEPF